jgi:hypothetical protein
MIKTSLPAVLMFGIANALRAATPVDSTIVSATVYFDRAVITRTAGIDVTAGEQQFVFGHLPATLLTDSIQVSGRGSAQTTILDVTVNRRWLDTSASDAVRKLESEVKVLQQQRREITDRSTTLDQQQALLTQIANWAASFKSDGNKDVIAVPQMNPAGWQQLLDFYTAGLERIAAEKRSLDERRDDLDNRIAALNSQSSQSQGPSGKEVDDVTVRASVGEAGKLTLTLSYAVPAAHWTPTYDARLSSSDRKLSLGYFGTVRQNTGEDWKSIELTLSTARPSLGGAAPQLQPWVLAQRESVAAGGNALKLSPYVVEADEDSGYAATSTLAGTRIRSNLNSVGQAVSAVNNQFLLDTAKNQEVGGQGSQFKSREQAAALDTRATSATFRVPGTTDVPSDNAPHRVGIADLQLSAKLAYESTPKLSPAAFLSATALNDSGYPLLIGEISSFLDGMFVAKGQINTLMPGEKLDLAFGVDDGIKVERKLINLLTEDVGLVTSQVRVSYDVLITVTNNKSTAVAITVKDQIPLSRHEKIKVEQLEPDPNGNKPDDEGVLAWALNLKPGEKRELPLKFSITYPKDFPVTGLE